MQLRPLPPPATAITIAYGDGVGPEVLEAALCVLREADVMLSIETIEVGQRIYDMESQSALLPSAWEKIYRTGILLLAPVACPEGMNPIHNELYHKLSICEGERHRISEQCAADVHLGERFAIFSPAHDTQDTKRGTDTADASSMLLACIFLLSHIGQHEAAARIWRALCIVLETGASLGTRAFAEAVIEHLWDNH